MQCGPLMKKFAITFCDYLFSVGFSQVTSQVSLTETSAFADMDAVAFYTQGAAHIHLYVADMRQDGTFSSACTQQNSFQGYAKGVCKGACVNDCQDG